VREPFSQFAGLGVPHPDPVAGLESGRRAAAHRSLHFARAFGDGQAQSGRKIRPRQAVPDTGAGSHVAAGEQRGDVRRGLADHRQGVEQGRPRREPGVRVEQGGPDQAGAGRELGHRGVLAGSLQAAGPTAIDELKVRDTADELYRRGSAFI
jgi:hypothetical protein